MKQFLNTFIMGLRNGKNYRLFVPTKTKKQDVIKQFNMTFEEAENIECAEI